MRARLALDQRFFKFAGIDADSLKAELAKGKGDGQILEWIIAHSRTKPKPWDINQWSDWMDRRFRRAAHRRVLHAGPKVVAEWCRRDLGRVAWRDRTAYFA